MRKLFCLLLLSVVLVSCGRMTQEEIQSGKEYCLSVEQDFVPYPGLFGDTFFCSENRHTDKDSANSSKQVGWYSKAMLSLLFNQ